MISIIKKIFIDELSEREVSLEIEGIQLTKALELLPLEDTPHMRKIPKIKTFAFHKKVNSQGSASDLKV